MRYTESDLKTSYDSFIDYLNNLLSLVILAPLRLVNEISKKVVYLGKERLKLLIAVAIGIAVFVCALQVVISTVTGSLTLWGGKFPLTLQIAGILCMVLLLGFVKHYDYTASRILDRAIGDTVSREEDSAEKGQFTDSVEESTNKWGEETEHETSGFGEVPAEEVPAEEALAEETLAEEALAELGSEKISAELDFGEVQFPDLLDFGDLDCGDFSPNEILNVELLNKSSVKDYKNRHVQTVEFLKNRETCETKLFSSEDLSKIQERYDRAIAEESYIGGDSFALLLENNKYDDFSLVDNLLMEDDVSWLKIS